MLPRRGTIERYCKRHIGGGGRVFGSLRALLTFVLTLRADVCDCPTWSMTIAPLTRVTGAFCHFLHPLYSVAMYVQQAPESERLECAEDTGLILSKLVKAPVGLERTRASWENRWEHVPPIGSGEAWLMVTASRPVVKLMHQSHCHDSWSMRNTEYLEHRSSLRFETSKELSTYDRSVARARSRMKWNIEHPILAGLPGLGKHR